MRRLSLSLSMVALLALAACATEPERKFLVFFPSDAMTLTSDASLVVKDVAKTAEQTHASRVTVVGQAGGGSSTAATLANQRAATVAAALAAAGVNPARIQQEPGVLEPGNHDVSARTVVIRLES